MALIHSATVAPSKKEAIAGWLPQQAWAAGDGGEVELLGAYRFDDPHGAVGLEGHLVRYGADLLHVPLTYRGAPLEEAEDALVCTMSHSVLGDRWIYDGCADPVFLQMLAAATVTGVGQAAQIAEVDGRVVTRQPSAVLTGGRLGGDARIAVGNFDRSVGDGATLVLTNTDIELIVARRLGTLEQGDATGDRCLLTATWSGGQAVVAAARALR